MPSSVVVTDGGDLGLFAWLSRSKKRVTDKAQRLKRRAKLREKYLQGLIAKGKRAPAGSKQGPRACYQH